MKGRPTGRRARDLTGQRFAKLTAIHRAGHDGYHNVCWLFECDCGRFKVIVGYAVTKGDIRSCGCLARELTAQRSVTHGHARSGQKGPEYRAWCAIKTRCYNAKADSYAHYGGRGIQVHSDWLHNFEAFLAAVGPRPGPNYSLDRIDVNKHYEPGNIRWATAKQQASNRRDTIRVILDGAETSLSDAARRRGVNISTVRVRLKRGLPMGRALGMKE